MGLFALVMDAVPPIANPVISRREMRGRWGVISVLLVVR